ncbi:MFS transporter [Methylorubrum sp. Q1]|uniref:MFS transporter n=1 Tax=Methylorubrum sp. Q1 TaxID=2562453 RepID=UPI001FE16988|nr:MFS transporter [Methylorubrum sp. Q1]
MAERPVTPGSACGPCSTVGCLGQPSSQVLAYTGSFCLFSYIAPLLIDVTGLAPAHVGALMLAYGVAAAIGNGLGGRLTDRFGPDRTVALILAGLVLVLAMIGALASFVIPMAILVALLGALTYAAVPALQARVIGLAGRHASRALAAAAGLNIAGFNAGIALGSLLGGGVIAAWDVSATAFVGAGAAASGLGVLAMLEALVFASSFFRKPATTFRDDALARRSRYRDSWIGDGRRSDRLTGRRSSGWRRSIRSDRRWRPGHGA